VRGRKRHVLTDTPGNLIRAFVTAADLSDAEAAEELLALGAEAAPDLELVFGDSHYGGPLADWSERELGVRVEVVKRPEGQPGFAVVPKRWAVERSLAWYGRCRRLAKDYEHAEEYAESWLYLASVHCLLRRIAPDPAAPAPYSRPITPHPDQLRSHDPPAA
jgi:putative transposase